MKRLPALLAIAALAACSPQQAAETKPAAPPAPVYAETWLSSGDADSSLNIHETKYGLAGRLRDTTGKSFPIRNIVMNDITLSFVSPALEASFTATKAADGSWAGKWAEGGKTPEDLVLKATTAPVPMPTPGLPETRFVKLPDGRQMFLSCIGSGTPAVIFDAGAGGDSNSWRGVHEEVGKTTQACAYDRAGRGVSDPGPLPRDTAAVANDIEAMLTAAGIAGPYVLVGHSLGSYHVRQFANTRFDKIAGMVLVDPSGDGQTARFNVVIPNAVKVTNAAIDKQRSLNCAATLRAKLVPKNDPLVKDCLGNDGDMIEQYLSEVDAMEGASTQELAASHRSWGDMPLIVLTRGDYEAGMPPELTASDRAGMKTVWTTMHDEMTALSTAGQHRVVDGAGHSIQRDKPQAVIDAVNEVVAKARERSAPR